MELELELELSRALVLSALELELEELELIVVLELVTPLEDVVTPVVVAAVVSGAVVAGMVVSAWVPVRSVAMSVDGTPVVGFDEAVPMPVEVVRFGVLPVVLPWAGSELSPASLEAPVEPTADEVPLAVAPPGASSSPMQPPTSRAAQRPQAP